MITKFVTEVTAKFNPFSPKARTVRAFLALLPPAARTAMKVDIRVLSQKSKDKETLFLKFKDGKELDVDLRQMTIRDVVEQVNRHSRGLQRKEDLAN